MVYMLKLASLRRESVGILIFQVKKLKMPNSRFNLVGQIRYH